MSVRHDDGRGADMQHLRAEYGRTTDPKQRAEIRQAAHSIGKETGLVRDMRASLLKAKRNGDVAEMKNIHEDAKRNAKYRND